MNAEIAKRRLLQAAKLGPVSIYDGVRLLHTEFPAARDLLNDLAATGQLVAWQPYEHFDSLVLFGEAIQ